MNQLTITTPFNIDLEFTLAPIHKRGGAALTDICIAYLFSFIVTKWVVLPLPLSHYSKEILIIIFVSIPVFLFPLICEVVFNGITPGKKVFDLKTIDMEGNEPTLSQYLIRFMLNFGNYTMAGIPYIVMSGSVSFFLGLFYVIAARGIISVPVILFFAFTRKGQRMGDLAGGTVVIDRRSRVSINETIYLDVAQAGYKPAYPEVMKLSDRDINGIKNLLSIKPRSREVDMYVIDVSTRIKDLLKVESDMHPYDFLEQLLKDYNAITMS